MNMLAHQRNQDSLLPLNRCALRLASVWNTWVLLRDSYVQVEMVVVLKNNSKSNSYLLSEQCLITCPELSLACACANPMLNSSGKKNLAAVCHPPFGSQEHLLVLAIQNMEYSSSWLPTVQNQRPYSIIT